MPSHFDQNISAALKSLNLPINEALPELLQSLIERDEAVLEAPPGAGKTTCVPLALLDAPWLGSGIIMLLEPRRLAARAAAERMAQLLGEKVGETVGYRIRLDSCIGKDTRIQVVTEGILTRQLQADPSLEGVAVVIFDEYHERSLDADLGLALCQQGRELFRDADNPLKLVVMSATLDGVGVSQLLNNAPVVKSLGRCYPVDIHYTAAAKVSAPAFEQCARVVEAIDRALAETTGSILVFLPGQGEIRRVASALQDRKDLPENAVVMPLYGDLTMEAQRRVLAPATNGIRKVVLATSIAETSLTVAGVTVIVDAGLSRLPQFDPASAMTRLHTTRLSRAASEQRAGRAGRTEPGRCYRLWSEAQQQALAAYTPAEILQADLAPLALQLLQWGVSDPLELSWLDPPPAASYGQAIDLLIQLKAVAVSDGSNTLQLTAHGAQMVELPLHPRLAHMLVRACHLGLMALGCDLAALLSERDPLSSGNRDGQGCDIELRLLWLRESREGSRTVRQRIGAQSRQYAQMCRRFKVASNPVVDPADSRWIGLLLAFAYPDRIGQKKCASQAAVSSATQGVSQNFRLSNGRSVELSKGDALTRASYIACAEVGGRSDSSRDRVFLAAALDEALLLEYFADSLTFDSKVDWDGARQRFVAEQHTRLGSLIVASKTLTDIDPELKVQVLCDLIRARGLRLLPWSDALQQWLARVRLVRAHAGQGADWPDVSEVALLENLEGWLGPYLNDIRHIDDFAKLDLKQICTSLLPWALSQQLDALAPERWQVPSGSNISIDYRESPPVLAVRLQEMFGCLETPSVASGKVKLLLHLLSPAKRPLQVTQDIAGFWSGSYEQVKKEMKGRYPKHFWPDNPLECEPTSRVKHPKPRR